MESPPKISKRFWSPTLTRRAAQRAGMCDACSRGEFGEVLYLLSSDGTEDVGMRTHGGRYSHLAAGQRRDGNERRVLDVEL